MCEALAAMRVSHMAVACSRLLRRFGCVPVAEQPGYWTYAPGAKHPSEQELRKEVSSAVYHCLQIVVWLVGCLHSRDQF